MNAKGEVVVTPNLDAAWESSEGIAIGARDGRYVFFSTNGKELGQARFEHIGSFHQERAVVYNGEKYGFVSPSGQIVIPPTYSRVPCDFADDLACVTVDNKWGYIDRAGVVAIPPRFDTAKPFNDGRAVTVTANTTHIIDREGKPVIDDVEASHGCAEGVCTIKREGVWSFTDLNGRDLYGRHFDDVELYSNGLAGVKIGSKWGYIDRHGVIVIAPKYDLVGSFGEGLAAVQIGKKFGFIDAKGSVVIPFQFQDAAPFCGGVAFVIGVDTAEYVRHDGTNVRPQLNRILKAKMR